MTTGHDLHISIYAACWQVRLLMVATHTVLYASMAMRLKPMRHLLSFCPLPLIP